jgi:Outer membrane protein beta-barrel domain
MMKVIFGGFMLAMVFFHSADAQIFKDRSRSAVFGIRAGYSLATWNGLVYVVPDAEYKTIPGFHAGMFINIRLADAIGLEPGAFYSAKGWKGTGTLDDGTGNTLKGTLTNKLTYIDFPLLLRFYVKGLNFGAGPQVSLLMSSQSEFNGTINQVAVNTSDDTRDYINDSDFGLVLSVGYEFMSGLSLHATYDLGLTNNVAVSPYYTWDEARNRVLKFSVAFVLY